MVGPVGTTPGAKMAAARAVGVALSLIMMVAAMEVAPLPADHQEVTQLGAGIDPNCGDGKTLCVIAHHFF